MYLEQQRNLYTEIYKYTQHVSWNQMHKFKAIILNQGVQTFYRK